MVRPPEFNGIEYLVERRFPAAKALRIPPSLSSLSARGGLSPEARKEAIARIEAYAAELSGKSPDELEALITAERGKEIAERKARAEHEERQRFFNQASANADFEHWSRSAHWTLDEAIALSFGKAPEHVTWDKVKPFLQISPFAFQYQRRRDLALRAVTWKQLFDPVLPGIFLAWAKRTDLTVPPELESAIAARGVQVADWKSLYDELKATINENREQWVALSNEKTQQIDLLLERTRQLESQLASASIPQVPASREKPLGIRERESLLKLVIGMAVGGYGYDPKASRSEQPAAIANDLATTGVPLDADTVRKWLKEAAELLPRQAEKD